MGWKKHSAEEISGKLGRVRALVGKGAELSEAIKSAGISEATYFRWRAQFDRLTPLQVRKIKLLEQENARLRRVIGALDAAGFAELASIRSRDN